MEGGKKSMTRKEMKDKAKAGIRGASPSAILVTGLYLLLTSGVSMVAYGILTGISGTPHGFSGGVYRSMGTAGGFAFLLVNVLIWLYSTLVTFGYMGYTLKVSRGEEAGFEKLLDGFGMVGRVILLFILIGVFTALWSMLFVIPGIVAAYRYRMAIFILLDNPDCGPLEAIRRSKAMMVGRKANLFVFDLSFLNWALPFLLVSVIGGLLTVVSALLGEVVIFVLMLLVCLWVVPFYCCSQAVFYDTLSDGAGFRQNSWGPDVRF